MREIRFRPARVQVPGPGPVKVRGTRQSKSAWIVLAALVLAALLWQPLGLGRGIDGMRRNFVAMRYFKRATEALQQQPVNRARAVAMVDRALELAPENKPLTSQAGLVYLYAEAYEKAAQPLSRPPGRDLGEDIHLGHCLVLAGQHVEGLELLHDAYQRLGSGTPADAQGRYRRAIYLNEIGYSYAVAGAELDRAITLLQEAVQLQPLEPAFIDSLGWAYYRMGQYWQAMFYLERAVRLAGAQNNHETYYHLGAVYARMGYTRRAAKALANALEYDPQYQPAVEELQRLGWELPQPIRV